MDGPSPDSSVRDSASKNTPQTGPPVERSLKVNGWSQRPHPDHRFTNKEAEEDVLRQVCKKEHRILLAL